MSDVQGIEEEDDGDIFEQRLGADVLTGAHTYMLQAACPFASVLQCSPYHCMLC